MLESTYQVALAHELRLVGLKAESEVVVGIRYKDLSIPNAFRIDLMVEGLVVFPNPFWLASRRRPTRNTTSNRAFEAGWGGVVWKTLGEDPPVVNVSGPRYGALGPDGAHGAQQHRADHRPAAGGEPGRDQARSSATGRTAR
jgi:dihydroorotate dehydrogenase